MKTRWLAATKGKIPHVDMRELSGKAFFGRDLDIAAEYSQACYLNMLETEEVICAPHVFFYP